MFIPGRRALLLALAALAACAGTAAAIRYHTLGLTLTHYDARAHLVVARRIFDSITPGWQQIGAVWLPLPHLLNALPVQIDLLYRTGFSAIAISILSLAIASAAIAAIVLSLTESKWAAVAAAGVFALNPNVLYLQSTPMTEPLLMALTLASVALLMARSEEMADLKVGTTSSLASGPRVQPWHVGVAFTLACMTRYEAWPVTASRKASRSSANRLASVSASTVAVRATSRSSAISPNESPGASSPAGEPSTRTRSRPVSTT